ncbi:MAG: alpha/beta hydrolase [Sphingomonas fennica]
MAAAADDWTEGRWTAPDGTSLFYRDYPGDPAVLPLLCLHGLTRNARDSAGLAAREAPGRRVIALDFRGRGESAHARDPMRYVPLTYAEDVEGLVAALGLGRIAIVGTSLGGIVAMLLAARRIVALAGVVLNDIGPVLDPAGIARIRGYVGRSGGWPTWLHAARQLAETHGTFFPDYGLDDWIGMAKRLCRLTPAGRIVLDYDPRIAEPFRAPEADTAADLWPLAEALRDLPVLLVRGALSDILAEATAREMAARLPRLETVTIPRIGHAPTLDEPPAAAAIAGFLARLQ